jgi:hypothetical protein
MKTWKKFGLVVLIAVFAVSIVRPVYAQQSNSTNYSVDQAYFGSGAELEMSSGQYKATAGVGDTGAGAIQGVQFSSNAGGPTFTDPLLELIVSGGSTNHGTLSSSQTAFGAADIQVRTYNGSGYNLQITGQPPKQTIYTIPGLTTPTSSQTNVEQFGINLRDNSTPDVGANPVQIPDSTFSYGVPTADYDTPNLFKYISGDIIAQSVTATGQTNYKMSYVLNIKTLTPAGQYAAKLSVVVSAKF